VVNRQRLGYVNGDLITTAYQRMHVLLGMKQCYVIAARGFLRALEGPSRTGLQFLETLWTVRMCSNVYIAHAATHRMHAKTRVQVIRTKF
jgi:hypothetical protein